MVAQRKIAGGRRKEGEEGQDQISFPQSSISNHSPQFNKPCFFFHVNSREITFRVTECGVRIEMDSFEIPTLPKPQCRETRRLSCLPLIAPTPLQVKSAKMGFVERKEMEKERVCVCVCARVRVNIVNIIEFPEGIHMFQSMNRVRTLVAQHVCPFYPQ